MQLLNFDKIFKTWETFKKFTDIFIEYTVRKKVTKCLSTALYSNKRRHKYSTVTKHGDDTKGVSCSG